MFCYQPNLNSQVSQIKLPEDFAAVIGNPSVKTKVAEARKLLQEGDKAGYDRIKRSLPGFLFQASRFSESKNSHGVKGMWRNQKNSYLSGLVVIDYDHIDVEAFKKKFEEQRFAERLKDVLALIYVSASGEGIKVVFAANPEWGNLIDNQYEMSLILGEEFDKSCKDSSRLSFATGLEDVFFMDANVLFKNYGESYDKQYGKAYREGKSEGVKHPDVCRNNSSNNQSNATADTGTSSVGVGVGNDSVDCHMDSNGGTLSYKELKYGETPIERIAELYASMFGEPVEGDRHRYLIKMAGHFRYLCDNNPRKLKVAVRAFSWVRQWEDSEHNTSEIDNVCDAVCGDRMWREIPKALQRLLDDKNISPSASRTESGSTEHASGKGDNSFWDRLQPLLADDPTFSECTELVRDENKLTAIFAAGGMLATLMTRCQYMHYDGELHRLNPMVFIIGQPASGKGFVQKMDNNIMAALIAADAPGRKAEADYKKEQRKRKSSQKAAAGEKQISAPEAVIRYIPSRTSNNVFYRRSINAKEIVDGEQMQLHLYTFDSELDSQVTAQSGGSWIGKHDIELKAFHNEFSGVDYANSDSINEVIQVFWNQVITGTDVSLSKKINMRNINDGLCSRIAIIRMYDDGFSMIEKGNVKATNRIAELQKKWGFAFDNLQGEIVCPKLIDYCYDLCKKAGKVAEANDDRVLNFFRKRAIFYAEWFTIVRVVGRALAQKENGVDIDYHQPQILKSDLQFAELIYDAVIYWQDAFFGKMLEEVWQNAENTYQQRPLLRRSRNEQIYEQMPNIFTREQLQTAMCTTRAAANMQISRWKQRNLIKKTSKDSYEKI